MICLHTHELPGRMSVLNNVVTEDEVQAHTKSNILFFQHKQIHAFWRVTLQRSYQTRTDCIPKGGILGDQLKAKGIPDFQPTSGQLSRWKTRSQLFPPTGNDWMGNSECNRQTGDQHQIRNSLISRHKRTWELFFFPFLNLILSRFIPRNIIFVLA